MSDRSSPPTSARTDSDGRIDMRPSPEAALLSLAQLEAAAVAGEIETVLVVASDMLGRTRRQAVHGDGFSRSRGRGWVADPRIRI